MRIRVLARVLLVFLLLLGHALPDAHGQVGHDTDGANRGIELITSSDPSFQNVVEQGFPGFKQLFFDRPVRPLLAIMRNGGTHGIKAFVVKWDITGNDNQRHENTITDWVRGGRQSLSGEIVVCGPGESRILSPLFSWRSSSAVQTSAFSTLVQARLAKEFADIRKVSISLDAVIYDDGLLSGPDLSDFSDRYKAEQEGQRQEATSILLLLHTSAMDNDIKAKLQDDIQKGERSDEWAISLDAARGREARTLLAVLEHGGRDSLADASERLAASTLLSLHR